MKLRAVLTPKQIAKAIGWPEKRTLRMLKRLDGELLGMLLRNVGGTGKRTRYTCTLEALKTAAPQWFADSDALERIDALEEEQRISERVTSALLRRIEALEKAR